jgi:hypothetical protein
MSPGDRAAAHQATLELCRAAYCNRADEGDNAGRRADIKVHQDGTTWLVDVGMVCPSTRHRACDGHGPDAYAGRSTAPARRRSTATRVTSCPSSWRREEINAARLEFFFDGRLPAGAGAHGAVWAIAD